MNMIAMEIELALELEGFPNPKVAHRTVAGLDHRLDERRRAAASSGNTASRRR